MDVGGEPLSGRGQDFAPLHKVAHRLYHIGGLTDVLSEGDEDLVGAQLPALVGVEPIVLGEAQPGHKAVRGGVALVHEGPGLGFHVPGYLDAPGAELALDVLVHLPGQLAASPKQRSYSALSSIPGSRQKFRITRLGRIWWPMR